MFTIISVDDESFKINTGCTTPLLSTTLYDDSLKNTVIATKFVHVFGVYNYLNQAYTSHRPALGWFFVFVCLFVYVCVCVCVCVCVYVCVCAH